MQGCSGTIAGCSWVQGMGGDALMRGERRANEYMGKSGSFVGGGAHSVSVLGNQGSAQQCSSVGQT